MWDYTKEVMEHYRNPKNVGRIDDADAIGEAGSLACGDALKIYLKIKDGIVIDAKFQTFGCGSAVASSSILTEMIIGKSLDEVKKITNKDIADKLGGLPPEKMHCSVMGYEALENALSEYFHEDVAPSEKDKLVCKCFSVTEKQIINAIKENNLKTLEDVTNYTKAGGACGHCKENIKEILNKYPKTDYAIASQYYLGSIEVEKAIKTKNPQKKLKSQNIKSQNPIPINLLTF